MTHLKILASSLIILLCAACAKEEVSTQEETAPEVVVAPDEQANALFETFFDEWLARSPTFQTWLGIKDDYDKWDDLSEEHAKAGLELNKQQLERLRALDKSALSDEVQLSYELMERQLQLEVDHFKWRHHNYPVNQMFGWHSRVPSLLINQHTVTSVKDAQDYISRVEGVLPLFKQLNDGLKLRAEKGILAPRFVFPLVIDDSLNLIKGAPFDDGEPSPILADFEKKVASLEISDEEKQQLNDQLVSALNSSFKPGYEALVATLLELEMQATEDAGAWKFPEGEAFYNDALARTTTTALTADEIHELGLQEVARIHDEMRAIMKDVGFEGDLQAFFKHLKEDDKFYFEDSDQGREEYLARTAEVIDEFTARLDEVFITKPKAPLKVKRVEAFREKSAGKAFYQSPPLDGSRPGIYYANLYNMKEMPRYELEALVYHEGLPGHHMQLSISTELEGVPRFRKYGSYTAYIEGWGLYSEFLPKEMGLYQDPYSDFGRLAMELWRACRLVTDTGLHAKKWTREQAIDYLVENTPTVERGSRRAIERYIVMPSQATAYKIGMLKIIELREAAKAKLGDKFDIREYHEEVLKRGALPLSLLEQKIDEWVAAKQ
jgi:uncharacterized protein (DUF885 family)